MSALCADANIAGFSAEFPLTSARGRSVVLGPLIAIPIGMVNEALETRPMIKAGRLGSDPRLSIEPRRVCSRCGGTVEVMTITRKSTAGRHLPAKIGACVRCAQWFNEAGLGELNHYKPPSEG